MATERLPMRHIREILRLKWTLKRSHRDTARSLGISPGVVASVMSRATQIGLTWDALQELNDTALEERLYGPKIALLTPPTTSDEEWAAIGADMGDLLESSVNELRLLEPPEDASAGYADWLAARTRILAAIRDLQTAGASHDEQGIEESIARVQTAVSEADPLAEELGFADCSPTDIKTS